MSYTCLVAIVTGATIASGCGSAPLADAGLPDASSPLDAAAPEDSGPSVDGATADAGPFDASMACEAVAVPAARDMNWCAPISIPMPPDGMTFDRSRVNVEVGCPCWEGSRGRRWLLLRQVADEAACAAATFDDERPGGWYYDDPAAPTTIRLCEVGVVGACFMWGMHPDAEVRVQFGCETLLI
ncbi:MAG TPA: hypothetical protein ENK57_05480 [Polyangiaceae bacterium]|nr:hypothetical protein [Polyangiaceae bacterium]